MNEDFVKALDKAAQALYVLNLEWGNLLNEGLEDRIDQLINLIDIQLKEMKPIEA